MPSEWAKKTANAICDTSGFDEGCLEECVSAIARALDAARIEGLEEAVKIADSHADHGDAVGDMRQDVCASLIANDIRARIKEVEGRSKRLPTSLRIWPTR